MKNHLRYALFLAAGLLITVLILAWNFGWLDDSESTADSGSNPDRRNEIPTKVANRENHQLGGNRDRERHDSESGRNEESSKQFPRVENLLSDDSLSLEATAAGLRQILSEADASILEKEEALAHGLHLDDSQFFDLAADSRLPQPLAMKLFDHVLNQNQSRGTQVKVCLDLLSHEDAEIRAEVAEQLAFYIGLEEYADQPEVLRTEAKAFLEEWAQIPPPEENPPKDIIVTEPIDPTLPVDDEEE